MVKHFVSITFDISEDEDYALLRDLSSADVPTNGCQSNLSLSLNKSFVTCCSFRYLNFIFKLSFINAHSRFHITDLFMRPDVNVAQLLGNKIHTFLNGYENENVFQIFNLSEISCLRKTVTSCSFRKVKWHKNDLPALCQFNTRDEISEQRHLSIPRGRVIGGSEMLNIKGAESDKFSAIKLYI